MLYPLLSAQFILNSV